MKVKLYKLLRMLRDDKLIDGERFIFKSNIYMYAKKDKNFICADGKNSILDLNIEDLDKKCELIDRK